MDNHKKDPQLAATAICKLQEQQHALQGELGLQVRGLAAILEGSLMTHASGLHFQILHKLGSAVPSSASDI